MENKIETIRGIECYEKDGTAYLKLEAVARGLGFTQKQHKSGGSYTSIRWERVEQYLNEIGFPHKWGKEDFIPENVFYRLAMKAKNETAEKFQALVADEIIPSIRKTGGYFLIPKTLPEALRAYANEVEKNQKLLVENELQKQIIADYEPKAEYYDEILSSKSCLFTSQIAADYGISAQKLNKILNKEGIQYKVGAQWLLYQSYRGKGYTKSRTIHNSFDDGSSYVYTTTLWTQKGRLLIHEILKKNNISPKIDS